MKDPINRFQTKIPVYEALIGIANEWVFVTETHEQRHFVTIDMTTQCRKFLDNEFGMVQYLTVLRNRKFKQLLAEFKAESAGDGDDPAIPSELMTPRIITVDVHFPDYVASVAVLSSWRRSKHLQIECNRSNMELLLTQLPEPAARRTRPTRAHAPLRSDAF